MFVHRQAPSPWRQEPPRDWWEWIAVVKASQDVNEPRESGPAHAEQAAVLDGGDVTSEAFGVSALLMQPIGIKTRPYVSALTARHAASRTF